MQSPATNVTLICVWPWSHSIGDKEWTVSRQLLLCTFRGGAIHLQTLRKLLCQTNPPQNTVVELMEQPAHHQVPLMGIASELFLYWQQWLNEEEVAECLIKIALESTASCALN